MQERPPAGRARTAPSSTRAYDPPPRFWRGSPARASAGIRSGTVIHWATALGAVFFQARRQANGGFLDERECVGGLEVDDLTASDHRLCIGWRHRAAFD